MNTFISTTVHDIKWQEHILGMKVTNKSKFEKVYNVGRLTRPIEDRVLSMEQIILIYCIIYTQCTN